MTVLATAVLAALWARRDNTRQQRLATASQPKSLLGRLGDAVATRLQVNGRSACPEVRCTEMKACQQRLATASEP